MFDKIRSRHSAAQVLSQRVRIAALLTALLTLALISTNASLPALYAAVACSPLRLCWW